MVKSLSLISKNFFQYEIFSNFWKKSNIVTIHKKRNRLFMVNYCPVLLLPICGKIFERLIFKAVFKFLEENKLTSHNQSGFWPDDSCENQRLSIVHSIYADFDQSPSLEARTNFLDSSKAFDKVWHKGQLYKLETVVVSGQSSNWSSILGGISHGSILGSLLFLVYINDFPYNL